MRILSIVLLLLFSSPIFAQGIIDKLAELTCLCMEDKGVENKSTDELTQIMTDCLTQNLIENIAQFQQELSVEITDQEAMQKVGEQIGAKMAVVCPTTIMALATAEETPIEEAEEDENTFTGEVTVVKADGGLTLLFLSNPNGMTEPYVWLAPFDGDEALIELKEDLKGTTITVRYQELDIFVGSQGTYVTRKVITAAKIED